MSDATARLTDALSDRYRIERELGAGGMATVYLAEDLKHHRKVAIKVLHPELSAVLGSERFLKEIELTASLQHPNILPLFDSGSAEGLLYYVMPYVEGETLRARLKREHQLPIPDAVRIATAVAAALDYAHRHGAVHRDIKPENILLSDGNALVADFGIALALRDAGGARLTETGLSLGTPQYMSPEQATAERTVDARSDIYSLGATLYEMLAGEPPFTAPTTQGVISKMLTQPPVRLRVLRDTVPPGLDNTVDRMLAKLPADRFSTCRHVVDALAEPGKTPAPTSPFPAAAAPSWKRPGIATLIGAVLLGAVFGGSRLVRGDDPAPRAGVALQNRTQLTTSGRARAPAISGDGKQFAFVSTECTESRCSDAVDLQDVAGGATHRVLSLPGAVAYNLWWSQDRRHLMLLGTIDGRTGFWLLSALGGSPRYLTGYARFASFTAGGDSLMISTSGASDGVSWLRISGLDGTAQDNIPVGEPPENLWAFLEVPGTPWIVVQVNANTALSELRIIDHHGSTVDQVNVSNATRLRASRDAIWVEIGSNAEILRIALDRVTGKLSAHPDTIFAGPPAADARGISSYDVTTDGSTILLDDGTYSYDLFALEWQEIAAGRLPDNRRIFQTSSQIALTLAPDASRMAILENEPGATGRVRLSSLPYSGGSPTPVVSGLMPGTVNGVFAGVVWSDSGTVGLTTRESGHVVLQRVSLLTAGRSGLLTLPDSVIGSFDWLPPGGWVWIDENFRQLHWQTDNDRTPNTVALPSWYASVSAVEASPDGRRLAFYGMNHTLDSMRFSVVSLPDGAVTSWATFSGEGAWPHWLANGTLLVDVHTGHGIVFYQLLQPGRTRRVGEVPRPVVALGISGDMKHAAVATREYRGDIWMTRVLKH